MNPSERNHRESSWHAVQIVLGFMAAFVVGDWVVGWIALPWQYTGRNAVLHKLALYETESQVPDVVFLGSSHEWCGIDPVTVDETALGSSGVPVRSLNLASSSASTVTSYLLARRIVESDHHPKLVYLGVSPAVTDSNETDMTLNALRALGEFRDLRLAWSCQPAMVWDTLATSLLRSYYLWNDARTIARRIATGAPVWPRSRILYTDRGWAQWLGKPGPLPRTDPPLVDADALFRITNNFMLHGPLAEALEKTVELLKSAGIEVRLLEIPVATIAAPWSRPRSNTHYRAMVERIANATHTHIVRLPEGFLNDSDFFDPVHLHARGARKLSRWLATDVVAALRNDHSVPARSRASS